MTEALRAWQEARRLLCIRLDSMGDVLMTTPAIRALKEQVDGRHVTLLTSRAGAVAARYVLEVDEVLTYDAPWMKPPFETAVRSAIVDELQGRHFDGAVVFGLHTQSPLPAAFLCWLAAIPLVAARCRENPYHLVTTWLREDEPHAAARHDVERQLSLAAAVGATTNRDLLSFHIREADRAAAAAVIAPLGLAPGKWCVIHPGASAASRRYPVNLFALAAQSLIREDGWQVLVAGDTTEEGLVAALCEAAGAGAYAVERLSLGVLAALIEAAPVLIANNSGPAHLAAAVGTPVVDLYALTNPQHAPWRVPHRLLSHDVECKYCYRSVCPEGHHRCLRLVRPEEVAAAARALVHERHVAEYVAVAR